MSDKKSLLALILLALGQMAQAASPEQILKEKELPTTLTNNNPDHDARMLFSSRHEHLARSLSADEQVVIQKAFDYLNVSSSEVDYSIREIPPPLIPSKSSSMLRGNVAASTQSPTTNTTDIDQPFDVAITGRNKPINFKMGSKEKKRIRCSKQGKKGRGLSNEVAGDEEVDLDLEVSNGVIDDLDNGLFGVVTKTYNATTGLTTTDGLIWEKDRITEIRTYTENNKQYEVTMTTSKAGVMEKFLKHNQPHKHPEEKDIGRRRLAIPIKNGLPLVRAAYQFTKKAAADLGNAPGYALNSLEFVKAIYKAQGVQYELDISRVIVKDIDFSGISPIVAALSTAGRVAEQYYDTDVAVAIIAYSEAAADGIGGIAPQGLCQPYFYNNQLQGKKYCGGSALPDLFTIAHEVFGHVFGAAHEQRYNPRTPGADIDPFGSAFAYVSPDEQYGTIMSYHWPLPRYSQNGATYQGQTIGGKNYDNIRTIKYMIPKALEWRNYYNEAPTTQPPVAPPSKGPTVLNTPKPSVAKTNAPTPALKTVTGKPTAKNTVKPTAKVTGKPTIKPTSKVTDRPTKRPTFRPTFKTAKPTMTPTTKRPTTKSPTGRPTKAPTYDQTPALQVGDIVGIKYTGTATTNFETQIGNTLLSITNVAGKPVVTLKRTVNNKLQTLILDKDYSLDAAVLAKLTKLYNGDTVFKILNDGMNVMLAVDVPVQVKQGKKTVTQIQTLPLVNIYNMVVGQKLVTFPTAVSKAVDVSAISKFQKLPVGRRLENEGESENDTRIKISLAELRDYDPKEMSEDAQHTAWMVGQIAKSPTTMFEVMWQAIQMLEKHQCTEEEYQDLLDKMMPKIFAYANEEDIEELIEIFKENTMPEFHALIEEQLHNYAQDAQNHIEHLTHPKSGR